MPFGLHNAPQTFQRLMNYVLRDCHEFAMAYIDDIVIFSQSWEEHLRHLREMFRCLVAANLHVKLKKCQFGCIKARYLGHSIGQGEIEPDVDKVIAVSVKKDVQAFLGLVGYYWRFIPQFAAIAIPLTNLVKKNKY